jgi:hypothetical protein
VKKEVSLPVPFKNEESTAKLQGFTGADNSLPKQEALSVTVKGVIKAKVEDPVT